MPTPRRHGGAALEHIPLTTPAFLGLNKEAEKSILGPEWCTRLENAVIDETNRVASRKGFDNQTVTPLPFGEQFIQLFEYRKKDNTVEIIGTSDNSQIYRSLDNGTTWTNITGSAVVTSPNMQFQNFNDKIIAFQANGNPLTYNGATFADIVDAGNQPQGGVGLAAFGRIWALNSTGVEIQYSGLLAETDWSSSDSGVLSVENVWPESDTIEAIAAFNGVLVIMGRNNIVMFTDGTGSAIGLDPIAAYVVDTISGIGTIARDSVQNVKGDLWFLSRDGLQSLGRLVQEKSNPLINLSTNVQDFLLEAINDPEIDLADARAVYSPEDRFYLLSLPRTRTVASVATESGRTFVFDTRGRLEDGSARCMGTWNWLVPRALCKRRNNDLLFAQTDTPGQVGKYAGYQDNGATYEFVYESGWIDITGTQGYLVLPKRIDGIFLIGQDSIVAIKWAFDFSTIFRQKTVTYEGVANFSEWGNSEFAIAEWGGGASLKQARISASGTGEYVKLGTQTTINGGVMAIQQLDVFAKIGRLK